MLAVFTYKNYFRSTFSNAKCIFSWPWWSQGDDGSDWSPPSFPWLHHRRRWRNNMNMYLYCQLSKHVSRIIIHKLRKSSNIEILWWLRWHNLQNWYEQSNTLHYGISYGFIYKLLSWTEDNEEFRSSCVRVFFTCQLGNTNGEKGRHGEKNKRLENEKGGRERER